MTSKVKTISPKAEEDENTCKEELASFQGQNLLFKFIWNLQNLTQGMVLWQEEWLFMYPFQILSDESNLWTFFCHHFTTGCEEASSGPCITF